MHSLLVSVGLFLLFLTPITGCSKKVLIPEEALEIKKIVDFIHRTEEMYEQGDRELFSLFSRKYLDNNPEMKKRIEEDFFMFSHISLDVMIYRVEMRDGDMNITIHWTGLWKAREKTYMEGGTMILVVTSNYNLLIKRIGGKSPFGISRLFHDQS